MLDLFVNNIYIVIVVGFLKTNGSDNFHLPYYKIISTHNNFKECEEQINKTHDYYLAKDIRRKKSKQRNPKFIYDIDNNKILVYKSNEINYYASCKSIQLD